MKGFYANAALRDRFLQSLEEPDRRLCVQLAQSLVGCGNPLPGLTCAEFGLPAHSTYDCAARRVLSLYSIDGAAKEGR